MPAKTRTELLELVLELKKGGEDMAKLLAETLAERDNWRKSTEDLQAEKAQYLEEIERLRRAKYEAEQAKPIALAERDVAQKRAVQIEQENERLRDRLHAMTVDNARLEGVLERVREFDPISEKQMHAEQPHFAGPSSPRPTYGDTARALAGAARETWYQRRA